MDPTRALRALALIVAAVGRVAAQVPVSPPAAGIITGRVVDAVTE